MTNVIHRLTQVQVYKPCGLLVNVRGKLEILSPSTTIVSKQGVKQFYTYINHAAVLVRFISGQWVAQGEAQQTRPKNNFRKF